MAHDFERLEVALAERYRLERELGRGGMATVYLAHDLRHDRAVALKLLRPELSTALGPERFLREIAVTARLDHPHILPLLDSGESDGFLYYVMPYVEGESLRDRLDREQQLPLDEALQIAREVADALSYAHTLGIVHRDVKPENILLSAGHARVADFGIARGVQAAGGETLTKLTATGIAAGTPLYMSPEQASVDREVDARTDVYSLACVLYEMLAGQPPYSGATPEAILARKSLEPVPSLRVVREAVPLEVEAATQKALANVPADRFRTAAAFSEALTPRIPAAAPPPRRITPLASTLTPSSWGKRLVLVAGLPAAVLIVGGLLFLRPSAEPPGLPGLAQPRTALAVLPFQNLSTDPADAYFAGGLHDELLTQLSRVGTLSLRGRTSVMGYAGTTKSSREIGEELQVSALLGGSVQVVGGRLRVSVQLVDAATDVSLWADRYDRTLEDAFGIQSDVAQRVVTAVGAALGRSEEQALTEAPTANPEAYRLYLQGRDYHRRPGFRRQNLEIAQQLYEQAIALDPEFALAFAQLADVHGYMRLLGYDPSPQRVAQQEEAAESALRLAPESPQARQAMGVWHSLGRLDWGAALAEFEIALRGLPNDAELVLHIGYVHRRLGNWDEVYAAFERAAELDPRNAEVFQELGGHTYQRTRRYADAVRAYDRALALAPDLHLAAVQRGWTFVAWHGELDTLRVVLDAIPDDADLGYMGTAAQQRALLLLWAREAESLLEHLENIPPRIWEGGQKSLFAAWAHQLRGDFGAARAALDSARILLEAAIQETADLWGLRAARGLTLAGLGHRAEALREAEWLAQSFLYQEDALTGPLVQSHRAMILAQAGDAQTALDEIERLLAGPSSPVSVHTLQLNPMWDPIREQPRFSALLAHYGLP